MKMDDISWGIYDEYGIKPIIRAYGNWWRLDQEDGRLKLIKVEKLSGSLVLNPNYLLEIIRSQLKNIIDDPLAIKKERTSIGEIEYILLEYQ
jgi:hypothetical protein